MPAPRAGISITSKPLHGGKRKTKSSYKKRRGGENILDQLQKDRLVGGKKSRGRKSMRLH